MNKILLINKKILLIILFIFFLIYFFFLQDKKEYFICNGKLPDNKEITDVWIFDVKKKLGYRNSLEHIPFFIKVYSDMYKWDNLFIPDRTVDLYYTFFKTSESLRMVGKFPSSKNEHTSFFQCKRKY